MTVKPAHRDHTRDETAISAPDRGLRRKAARCLDRAISLFFGAKTAPGNNVSAAMLQCNII
ncbi:hypothetical protein [Lysobacter capsici]|uniref:hypothetical protein n=1 Tax=Lysobacter capsici TaxID=435897 RepID=UPI0012FDCBCB|nr:hypothetical protein [Lysobacter capsici]